jgi:hypothetical protein
VVLQRSADQHRIVEALAAGRLTVRDPAGVEHGIFARCPRDGIRAYPHHTAQQHDVSGFSICQVIVRCFACGHSWAVTAADVELT